MTARRAARLLALAVVTIVLSSCRVDTSVSLVVKPNGSGAVTVKAVADAELVAKAPNLAADIRTTDLQDAGWKVSGPTAGDDGTLAVELVRSFRTPAEATSILSQINGTNGPLHAIGLARTGSATNSTWTLTGKLEVVGGLKAFADDSTVQLLGGAPYADDIRAMGLDLGDAVGVSFNASLPGKVANTTGLAGDGTISWKVPMDGSATDVATTVNNVDVASSIAGFGRVIVLLLLVAWVIGAVILLVLVRNAQSRRPRTPRF